jgi:hypothetical protein
MRWWYHSDVKKLLAAGCLLFAAACSSHKKATIPALNPEQANALLHYDTRAANWLTYVRKQNPACGYHIELPDQSAQPTEIDLDGIVWCGASPGPREYSASVVFLYDKAEGRWKLGRFSSQSYNHG